MSSSRNGWPWRAAVVTGLASAVALAAAVGLAAGLQLRQDLGPAGGRVQAIAADLAARRTATPRTATPRTATPRPAPLRAPSRVAARIVDARGGLVTSTGPQGLFRRGSAPWWQRLATVAVGWQLLDGAVAAERRLPSGERLLVRAPLARGTGTIGAAAWGIIGGAVALLAGAIGAAAGWWRSRLGGRTRRMAAAAEGIASGR
ncbi:MAG: hypothetical protein QOK40_3206, partial [Miltoncostaeaceae bacterium]|nr:hypothetical protein [Miltoncostaeaceae bacterium]